MVASTLLGQCYHSSKDNGICIYTVRKVFVGNCFSGRSMFLFIFIEKIIIISIYVIKNVFYSLI